MNPDWSDGIIEATCNDNLEWELSPSVEYSCVQGTLHHFLQLSQEESLGCLTVIIQWEIYLITQTFLSKRVPTTAGRPPWGPAAHRHPRPPRGQLYRRVPRRWTGTG